MHSKLSARRGATIAAVVVSTMVVAVIVASFTALIQTQRRVGVQKELQLQAYGIAENAADYAYVYISNQIGELGIENCPSVPSSGRRTFTLPTAAGAFLRDGPARPSDASGQASPTFTTPDVRILAPEPRVRYFMDPNNPRTRSDPNVNQWVLETRIPVVAHVRATLAGQSADAYVRKDISVREIPLFQYAIYYSGQLQLHRAFNTLGDVHSNGPMLMNGNSGDRARYTGFVTTRSRFYRGSTVDMGGSGADAYGYTPQTPEGWLALGGDVQLERSGEVWIYSETASGNNVFEEVASNFDSQSSNWKEQSLALFKGHLRDAAHEVPEIKPYGSDGYSMDVVSTTGINEFNNGPYSLIEPLLPIGHAARKSASANRLKLAANASLILRLELADPRESAATPYTLYNKDGAALPRSGTLGGVAAYSGADLRQAANITDAFILRAYKYQGGPPRGSETTPTLVPVQLPVAAIGRADASIAGVEAHTPFMEGYEIDTGSWNVNRGLHDNRFGRPVDLLTLDMAELRRVMEAAPSTLTGADAQFRTDFKIEHTSTPSITPGNRDWNGLVYVEFPTSLDYATTASQAPSDGHVSYPFAYGSVETRHPDRASESDSRAVRTDGIVPLAPELRRYYSGNSDSEISNRYYAIPGLQVINATRLPSPAGGFGFTLATNGPMYLIGSYNSDGNYTTGTNINGTGIADWATADTGEISAAIFSDTLTVLSEEWRTDNHRQQSFHGYQGASEDRRNVTTLNGNNRIEIGASIATGEYPVFEFFIHALEAYEQSYRTGVNPIIFKGSLCAMFHSEIQHFKQAYGRDPNRNIEYYARGQGYYAIPAVRFHRFLVDGIFPPGTPMARVPAQAGFRLLRRGDPDDAAVLTAAGL